MSAAAAVTHPAKPAATRLVQGLVLLTGAAVLGFAVDRPALEFHWTPLVLGATYLMAALAGGRDGGHWSTALPLLGWGLSVAWLGEVRPADVDVAGTYLAGTGAGLLAAAALARRGVPVTLEGLAATVLLAGLSLALVDRVEALGDATTYAVALAGVGVVNLVLAGLRRDRTGAVASGA